MFEYKLSPPCMKTKISSILDTKTTNVSDVEYLLEEINDILCEAADVLYA